MNTSKLSKLTAATKAVAKKMAMRGMHGLACAAATLFAVILLCPNAGAQTVLVNKRIGNF